MLEYKQTQINTSRKPLDHLSKDYLHSNMLEMVHNADKHIL